MVARSLIQALSIVLPLALARPGEGAVLPHQGGNEGPRVAVSTTAQKAAGIVTAPLQAVRQRVTIRSYGTVIDPDALARLRRSYADALAQVDKTDADLTYARQEYVRQRKLYKEGEYASEKAMQQAQAAARSDAAATQAAATALQMEEATMGQKWGDVLAGWVRGNSGDFEQLIGRRMVLVQLTVAPGQLPAEAPPSALLETPTGQTVKASLVSAAPQTEPRIQGVSYFYIAPASPGLLPGMNVVGSLLVGPEVEGVMIPGSAIVWWEGEPWVYVRVGAERFQRRIVRGYTPAAEGWFVSKEFTPGEEVVVKGAQTLLSQELRSEIQGGD